MAFSISSVLRTSAAIASAAPVWGAPSLRAEALDRASLIAAAAGSRCSRLRLTSVTFAPASARARATPPVIPVPPPVMKATRSLRIPSAKTDIIVVQTLVGDPEFLGIAPPAQRGIGRPLKTHPLTDYNLTAGNEGPRL